MAYDSSYNYLESSLQKINVQYIALQESEARKNTFILSSIVSKIILEMRKDKLFNALYRTQYSGGSYYCGLKVGKPDEYDLDLLFSLPILCSAKIINSDVDGFVDIQMQNMANFYKQLRLSEDYPKLEECILDSKHNLSTEKVLNWMESLINIALNRFKTEGEQILPKFVISDENYYVNLRKQGPAFTLDIFKMFNRRSFAMSIDLVPCFVFTHNDWPMSPYRLNPIPKKNEFFVVPKSTPNYLDEYLNNPKATYWRLSFQEQENEIIKRSNYLKPALRLLKRIRDAWDHKAISSYYIKTIFLWEIEKNDIYWDKSLSYVFMTMLKRYQQYIERGNIPYYWNNKLNLLSGINRSHLTNTSDKLKGIIKKLEKCSTSPQLIEMCFYGPNWNQPEYIPESYNARAENIVIDKWSNWPIYLIRHLILFCYSYFFGKSNSNSSSS